MLIQYTLPIVKVVSVKNAQAMVPYFKKIIKIRILKRN